MYSLATVEPALGHRHGQTTSQCCFLPYYSLNKKLNYNLKIQQFSCRRPQCQFYCTLALLRHSVFPVHHCRLHRQQYEPTQYQFSLQQKTERSLNAGKAFRYGCHLHRDRAGLLGCSNYITPLAVPWSNCTALCSWWCSIWYVVPLELRKNSSISVPASNITKMIMLLNIKSHSMHWLTPYQGWSSNKEVCYFFPSWLWQIRTIGLTCSIVMSKTLLPCGT